MISSIDLHINLNFALLDGAWYSETELVRIAKRKGERNYLDPITLGTMLHSLNHNITNAYVGKKK
ncbi:MAG: hypothetical protein ACTSWE_08855 [Promethearchaeota archaeon]